MINFNLSKYLKEAMGYTRQESRPDYTWWEYDDLATGGDEVWQNALREDRSLSDVLLESGIYKNRIVEKIERTYGLPKNQAWKIFKVYIGYHKDYGGYVCGVGPYFGEREDRKNRFGYFVKRYRQSTPEEIVESAHNAIKKYIDRYGLNLDLSDLQFEIRGPKGEYDPTTKRQKKEIREVVPSLDTSNEETMGFFARKPMVGDGSSIGLNCKGLDKLMSHLYGETYLESLREKASEEGRTPQEARARTISDLSYLMSVYEKVKEKYNRAVESGEAAMQGIQPPPDRIVDLSLPLRAKQEMPNQLPDNKLQKRRLDLKKEIINVLRQGVNPSDVLTKLNEDPKRRKNPLTEEQISNIKDEISRDVRGFNNDYEALSNHIDETIASFETGRGYSDFKTALQVAKTYFTKTDIDPKTRTKMGIESTPEKVFDRPILSGDFDNYTSEDLIQMKEERLRSHAPVVEDEETKEEVEDILEREIGKDVQTDMIKEPPKPEEIKEKPQEIVEKTEDEEDTEKEEEEEEEYFVPIPPPIRGAFKNTLINLIKIAKESDDKGNYDDAEEIHKIIRKYVARIS